MVARLLLSLIAGYRLAISPWLGPHCRFYPSCSRYAEVCLRSHGVFEAIRRITIRLAKCHPFHPGGVDLP